MSERRRSWRLFREPSRQLRDLADFDPETQLLPLQRAIRVDRERLFPDRSHIDDDRRPGRFLRSQLLPGLDQSVTAAAARASFARHGPATLRSDYQAESA